MPTTVPPRHLVLDPPPPPPAETFRFGASRHPSGSILTLNGRYLIRDGRPWMPVMGEIHYSRLPESAWREALLRMKAGGIEVVATYVFWIHHEEIEGDWDWTGRRSLRRFVQLCRELDLLVAVRCGPWCHGEVRNGGLPDWLLAREGRVRSDDSRYLRPAARLYAQIASQLTGLLWKEGGPVIIIQLENEYPGPAEHLLSLKRLAREHGLDVPFYTRTGWPRLATPLPFGEIAPLFGAYAEGFWDRELVAMPGTYPAGFRFAAVRTESAIANEQLGPREAADEADAHRYPFLTCELGGGMMSSYHRRIRLDPADIDAIALVKVGSGGNLPGYYMYHGGTNPDGRLTSLMESQDTAITNWNDLPTKNYDFFAPLGQFHQVRPHYHSLRRLHLFIRTFGADLAPLPAVFPPPAGDDLRWCVRTDGTRGFVFVNNHERGASLPARPGVQFDLAVAAGPLRFPGTPVTIASGARFFWPFNLELAPGVRLRHATAQPLCRIESADTVTVFFAAQPGVPAEFALADGTVHREVRPARGAAFTAAGASGLVRVVLLDEPDSLTLWLGPWRGGECVVLSRAAVMFDGDDLHLSSAATADLEAIVFPAPAGLSGATDGVFTCVPPREITFAAAPRPLAPELRRAAGPARDITPGRGVQPVAAAPTEDEFAAAAEWRVRLPHALDFTREPWLRLHYRGDVLRVFVGERLINDDFFNGRPFELGLAPHAAELVAADHELRVQVLPLRADAPIHLPADARPTTGAVAELDRVELHLPGHARV